MAMAVHIAQRLDAKYAVMVYIFIVLPKVSEFSHYSQGFTDFFNSKNLKNHTDSLATMRKKRLQYKIWYGVPRRQSLNPVISFSRPINYGK